MLAADFSSTVSAARAAQNASDFARSATLYRAALTIPTDAGPDTLASVSTLAEEMERAAARAHARATGTAYVPPPSRTRPAAASAADEARRARRRARRAARRAARITH